MLVTVSTNSDKVPGGEKRDTVLTESAKALQQLYDTRPLTKDQIKQGAG